MLRDFYWSRAKPVIVDKTFLVQKVSINTHSCYSPENQSHAAKDDNTNKY